MSPISTCGSGSIAASPQLADRREIDAFAAELIDRFGPLPPEVDNLLQIIAIKRCAATPGSRRSRPGPRARSITFRDNRFANPAGLVELIQQQRRPTADLRPDQKLVICATGTTTRSA